MLTKRTRKTEDEEAPSTWRAVIYMREPERDETSKLDKRLSVNNQRLAGRCAATVLNAEVVGEILETADTSLSRFGLERVMDLVNQEHRIDYLIVSSLDQLADDWEEAFEIAWRLGFAGTVVIPVDAAHEFPWTGGLFVN